jgi:hypothetical protein
VATDANRAPRLYNKLMQALLQYSLGYLYALDTFMYQDQIEHADQEGTTVLNYYPLQLKSQQ